MIEQSDRLLWCDAGELVNRPPAPWQVRGVFREHSVVEIYGPRGCYKSFVALDLAASMAANVPWHGHDIVTPGRVIYIAAEGGGGMVQRLRAWAEQHHMRASQLALTFFTEPAILTANSDDIDLLIERIRTRIGWLPEGTVDEDSGHVYENPTAREWPVLIVIDTLARCFQGSENESEDMGQFVQGCDRLKLEFNCSILIIHHTGRDESHDRGHTSLGGACDTVFKLEADKDTHELTLNNEKMKDGREPEPIRLVYREVTVQRRACDDPLEDLTSVVIETLLDQTAVREQAIIDALGLGPLTAGELIESHDIPKSTAYRTLVGMQKKGVIIKEKGKWQLSIPTQK